MGLWLALFYGVGCIALRVVWHRYVREVASAVYGARVLVSVAPDYMEEFIPLFLLDCLQGLVSIALLLCVVVLIVANLFARKATT